MIISSLLITRCYQKLKKIEISKIRMIKIVVERSLSGNFGSEISRYFPKFPENRQKSAKIGKISKNQ